MSTSRVASCAVEMTREVTVPDGKVLAGRRVRLQPVGEADFGELGELLRDPRLYEHGYVMHRRPVSAEDAAELARSTFGGSAGKVRYAIRLTADSALGAAGTLVGTSGLSEIDARNESTHLGGTLYGARWWGTRVNPEAKLLLLAHCFEDCGLGRVKIQTDEARGRELPGHRGLQRPQGRMAGRAGRAPGPPRPWGGARRRQTRRRTVTTLPTRVAVSPGIGM